MTYNEFNNAILDFYVKRANSSFCNLSIDDNDIIGINGKVEVFDELKNNWSKLLENIDEIPQYFGLIAVQCLASSQRRADDENNIGENEYIIRLQQVLGIETGLQQLFIGQDNQNPIQEQIWFAAKKFLNDNYVLVLNIPKKTTYAGRYVQYPKSQSLLTKEDLKRFTGFFSEHFIITESISLGYFTEECKNNIQNIGLRQRTRDLFNDEQKKELCYQQIFNYFSNWDGTIYDFVQNQSQPKQQRNQNAETSRLILFFENNEPKIHLDRNIIDWKGVFSISNYHYFEKNILLFSEHEYYKAEYENVRVLEDNEIGYIVVDKITNHNDFVILNRNNIEKIDFGNSIFLFKVNSGNIDFGHVFKPNPAKLKGGIRLNRKKEYLLGFSPMIECDEAFSVTFEHKRLENNTFSNAGKYKIRVNGYKDIEIEIKAPQIKEEIITPKDKGWNIQNLSFESKNSELEGAILNIVQEEITQSITRSWIDVNLDKSKPKHQNNHLLTAINRAKYGNFKN
jgi:hypothetical protein